MSDDLRRQWLERLRHDLVKQAVWRARDLREIAAAPAVADILALRRGLFDLRDGDGRPVSASALWTGLRAELERQRAAGAGGVLGADQVGEALDGFGRSVAAAEAAAAMLDPASLVAEQPRLDAVLTVILSIEDAFTHLARSLSDE